MPNHHIKEMPDIRKSWLDVAAETKEATREYFNLPRSVVFWNSEKRYGCNIRYKSGNQWKTLKMWLSPPAAQLEGEILKVAKGVLLKELSQRHHFEELQLQTAYGLLTIEIK